MSSLTPSVNGGRGDRWLTAGQLLVVGAVGSMWLLLLAVHAPDRFLVDHVSGVWMALAHHLHQGVFYPPVAEAGEYGGTRYMPIPIGLLAGVTAPTGSYFVPGKLLGHAEVAVACLLALVAMRRVGTIWPLALALVAVFVASAPALTGGHGLRQDALPVALQLGALLVADRARTRRAIAISGALCALALLSKLTALWAVLAIPIWLVYGGRARAVPLFGLAFAASVLALGAAATVLSGGAFVDSMRATAGSTDVTLRDIIWAPARAMELFTDSAIGVSHVLPLGLVALVLSIRRRTLSVYLIAWLFSAVLLIVIVTHPGSESNHVIDLALLTVIAAAHLNVPSPHAMQRMMALVVSGVIIWAGLLGMRAYLVEPAFDALQTLRTGEHRYPGEDLGALGHFVSASDSVFSEDPGVSVLLGHSPVLLDPYVFRSLAAEHPEWMRDLARRIEAHEFDRIVLIEDLESSIAPGWYEDVHLGREIMEAVMEHYLPLSGSDPVEGWGYHVYAPVN